MQINRMLINSIIFASGVVLGVAVSCRYFKDKYESEYQVERQSLHDAYKAQKEKDDAEMKERSKKISSLNENKPEVNDYIREMQRDGYVNYNSYSEDDEESQEGVTIDLEKPERDTKDKPYVITPNDFGEFDDYEKIELTCYSDGVVTDDKNEILEDMDKVLGLNPLEHFGEYEDDSVFVRNDALKCDYEILKNYDTYPDSQNQSHV